MTAPSNLWAERHPSAETVADELRRLRFEMALATIRERDEFIQDLRETMANPGRYRDRRKQRRARRVHIQRQTSVAEFTAKQTLLAERILRDLANKTGGDT